MENPDYVEYFYNWKRTGYIVFRAGWQNCAALHSYGPAIQDTYAIHYILSGTGTFTVRGKEYHPKAGQLFCFSPYETVFYQADKDDPWSYVWINYMTTHIVPYRFEQPVIDAPFLLPIFESIRNYPDHAITGQSFVTNCLDQIGRQLASGASNSHAYVSDAIEYIRNHYSNENLSISEIAQNIGTNRYSLSKAFTLSKDISLMEYLIHVRLERAIEYMTAQKIPPTTAAYSVGYRNYNQFRKIFKKYYGVSPKVYQEQALEKSQL